MKKKALNSLFVILLILSWSGCKTSNEKFISEGVIEFSAEALDKTTLMGSMAPTKMTVVFKNNKSCASMSAAMGLFTTSFISDPDSKTFTQLVKMINKKLVCVLHENEINKENEAFNMQIIPTEQTKIIAGYNCKKALVHYTGGGFPDFEIYYTNELDIKNSNFANPFNSIDGVLMEYKMKKFGLEMEFKAVSVKKENVDDSDFEIPDDYKNVPEKDLKEIFGSFQ